MLKTNTHKCDTFKSDVHSKQFKKEVLKSAKK